jgi:hypothetical protein
VKDREISDFGFRISETAAFIDVREEGGAEAMWMSGLSSVHWQRRVAAPEGRDHAPADLRLKLGWEGEKSEIRNPKSEISCSGEL